MHYVVKYHIKNREGFLERYGCKKALNSEEVVKSHPEKMVVYYNTEKLSAARNPLGHQSLGLHVTLSTWEL